MRICQILNGIWNFSFYGDVRPVFPFQTEETMPVPGCFDLMEPYCGKRGYAVYQRTVRISGKAKLSIDGLGLYGEIYWDQQKIGECKFAYMPETFCFDAGEEENHELIIVLDNRHNFVDCVVLPVLSSICFMV